MDHQKKRSRVVGSLVGLAVCDAVGTTVEFMPPGSFDPVQDMVGGGKFSLLPGQVQLQICAMSVQDVTFLDGVTQWTDDTSMALCLAESLVECQGFNPVDQMKRYWRWYQVSSMETPLFCQLCTSCRPLWDHRPSLTVFQITL